MQPVNRRKRTPEMTTPIVSDLFVDIGNVLLTNGWDRVSRRRAAEKFAPDIDEPKDSY